MFPGLEIAERRHCFESSEGATGNDAQNVRQGDVPGRIPLSRRRPNAFCGSEGAVGGMRTSSCPDGPTLLQVFAAGAHGS